MRLKVDIYPNNEVRATLTPNPRFRKYSTDELTQSDPVSDETQAETLASDREHGSGDRSLLDITCDFQESLKPGYGGLPKKTVFGLRGKRTILRAGGMMERLFKPEECVFLTGTLPGSTSESIETLARWSGYAMNLLKTWVKYYADSEHSFYCWEWQKRGALHLHYCVAVSDPIKRQLLVERFRNQWCNILESISEQSGIDLFKRGFGGTWRGKRWRVQADAQTVHTSVAAYVSKYCSKGNDTNEAFHCPSRWWGVSRALLHATVEATLTLVLDSLSLRRALALFEEVIHVTDQLTLKSYGYRHGTGQGKSLVAYHYPQDNPEDIWKTLIQTFEKCSMKYSAKKGSVETSQVRMFEILHSSLSQNSSDVCLSVPGKEALDSLRSGQITSAQAKLSDLRELLSVTCLICSDRSSPPSMRQVRQFLRVEVKRMQCDELAKSIRPTYE